MATKQEKIAKADAAWEKIVAAWEKDNIAWEKANAAWEKAVADREKGKAAWEKANTDQKVLKRDYVSREEIEQAKELLALAEKIIEQHEQTIIFLRERVKALVEACELIIAVGDCMALWRIHDDKSVRELLEKHGAADIQIMAKVAEEKARATLAQLAGEKP